MGDRAALDGMARHLLRRGVTAFLPTAVTAPLTDLTGSRRASATDYLMRRRTGAEPLGSS